MEVINSKKYEDFKVSPNQPKSRSKASSNLIESIRATNGNMLVPAIIDCNNYIIDGHRRLEACIVCDVPFYYMTMDNSIPRSIIHKLNSTAKQWTTRDYINSYGSLDKDYKKLATYLDLSKLPVEAIKSFTGYSTLMLKEGAKIKIDYKDLKFKVKIYRHLYSIYYPSVGQNLIHRALASMYLIDGFNQEVFLDSVLKIKDSRFDTESNIQETMYKELINIYKGD